MFKWCSTSGPMQWCSVGGQCTTREYRGGAPILQRDVYAALSGVRRRHGPEKHITKVMFFGPVLPRCRGVA